MSTPYDQLFGVRSLNGVVEVFAKEAQNNSHFQRMFEMGRQMTPGAPGNDVVEWDERQMHRHLAPIVGHESPAPLLQQTTKLNRRSAVTHIKYSKKISARKLFGDRADGSLLPNAAQCVDLEVRDLVKTITNTIEYMAVNTLNGTLTVNSTNIPGTTVPFTLTYSPNTATVATTWATDSVDHLASINALKQDFYQACGLQPRKAICGATVRDHLSSSDQITELLRYSKGESILRDGASLFGPLYDGFQLGGLDWEINEAGYVPEGGNFTRFMPAEDDLFLLPGPDDLGDVLGMAKGWGFIPSGAIGAVSGTGGATGLVRPAPQPGWYSYAVGTNDPAGIEIFVGWVGLPILLYPNGICVVDVVP
jgi:hypothetical protein